MSLKYDLIYEDEGELRIRTVIAASKDEVKKLAEKSNVKTKGIVFSDKNQDPTEES